MRWRRMLQSPTGLLHLTSAAWSGTTEWRKSYTSFTFPLYPCPAAREAVSKRFEPTDCGQPVTYFSQVLQHFITSESTVWRESWGSCCAWGPPGFLVTSRHCFHWCFSGINAWEIKGGIFSWSHSRCRRGERLGFTAHRMADLSISLETNHTCENLTGVKILPKYIVNISLFQGISLLSKRLLSLAATHV